ncbi:DUF998 domain-containing protein [Planobispora takensis]|uniref:DUF998 domain-containing protein n=1 Tax=Planobispora takensis TaxID=1367882 RepID=A0A8J3WSS0_9ACTN|nr:DUF998 domain-containing protein [Planobispora takensis]GIH98236.1 hypothetical protein Pta02_02450 [Planobispora takensis]
MVTTLLAAPPPAGHPRTDARTERLLACGVIAGPLFVATFLIAGATRAHYDPLRHPVSSLALGGAGWVQTADFILAGLLTLAFGVGLRRVLRAATGPARGSLWGPLLIGVWAIGLIGAGIFTTDPVGGYPLGTPAVQGDYTGAPAALHDAFALLGFAALIAACAVFAVRFAVRHQRGWSVFSIATGLVFTAALVLSAVGFHQVDPLAGIAGLLQRTMAATAWIWIACLAVHAMRHSDRP